MTSPQSRDYLLQARSDQTETVRERVLSVNIPSDPPHRNAGETGQYHRPLPPNPVITLVVSSASDTRQASVVFQSAGRPWAIAMWQIWCTSDVGEIYP
jgi:hypothetical protein